MLNKFEQYLNAEMGSERSVKNYVLCIEKFYKQFSEFNQENLIAYFEDMKKRNLSSNTYNLYRYALMKYAKWIKSDVEFPKLQRVHLKPKESLTRDEVEEELFPYFKMLFTDPEKRKFIIRFMMLSMLRLSEVSNLKKADIDFKRRRIIVLGKGNKTREVPLHKSIVKDTEEFVNKVEGYKAFGITNRYITYICDQINNKLHYKKRIHPHLFRHAGARLFHKESGYNQDALRKILGHSSLETTQKYLGTNFDDLVEAMDEVKYKKGK